MALTLQAPEPGTTHWTTRDLARRTGVSHTTVHRIWKAHALQPHRLTTFKFTTDPQAAEKIEDVVGLYLHPLGVRMNPRSAMGLHIVLGGRATPEADQHPVL